MKRRILLVGSIVAVSLLHYLSPIHLHSAHAIFQRLYYIPVILGAYWFGLRFGLVIALLSAAGYLPHIFFQWSVMPHEMFTQYVEIVMFFVVGSMVGIMSDFHRAQQKRILEANEQIRRMDRLSLLGQLSAGLAHEIRNPLGSLMGSVQILDKEILPTNPKREFVEIIQKELRRLSGKLDEFLKFARPAPPHPVPNSLNDIVKESVQLVEKQAAQGGVVLNLHLAPAMPLAAVDSDHVKQILLNLLLNAVQASPIRGRITISTWANGRMVGLSVEDEGSGIPESSLEKIFDPFYTTKPEGTGLGLSIVKQLVDAMRGSIEVISLPKGVRFDVRIPNA